MAVKNLFNETELLDKIAKGDQRAFKIIYERYHQKIYIFSLWYLKSELDAEEVVQEIFLKLWLLGEEIAQIRNLEIYLRTLTRNRSLDGLRRKALELKAEKKRDSDWQEGHNDTEEQILLNDTKRVLQEAIDQLPKQQKLVYQLCSQDGLKNDEVAKQLNLSPLTVRTHMKLAQRFLRNYVVAHTEVAALLIILKIF
jgi:RNA polymerase sigma-70 factor (family 1)